MSDALSTQSDLPPCRVPLTSLTEMPSSLSPFLTDTVNSGSMHSPTTGTFSHSHSGGMANLGEPWQVELDPCLSALALVSLMIRSPEASGDDVLGTLALTFDLTRLRSTFPHQIVPMQVLQDSIPITRYRLHDEYAAHLMATMTLASNALNHYLRAAESHREFTFGSIRHYGGCTIEELVDSNWATALVASTIEQHILHRLVATTPLYNNLANVPDSCLS